MSPVTGSFIAPPQLQRGQCLDERIVVCPSKSEPLPCLWVQSHGEHGHLNACDRVGHESPKL